MRLNKRRILDYLRSVDSIKLGVLFVTVALILAFISINVERRTHIVEGEFIKDPESEIYNKYVVTIPNYLNEVDNELHLEYITDGSENSTMRIKDYDKKVIRNITLNPGEEKNVTLSEESFYLVPSIPEGKIYYKYEVIANHEPYGFLSIPAFFLTILGVYFFFRGRYERSEEEKRKGKDRNRNPYNR